MNCKKLKHYISMFLKNDVTNKNKTKLVKQLKEIIFTETSITDSRCNKLETSFYFIMYMED
jgi:hypothetical protein